MHTKGTARQHVALTTTASGKKGLGESLCSDPLCTRSGAKEGKFQ